MRGQEILLTVPARGTREEGLITTASLPGTIMEIVPAVAPTNGRFNWRAFAGAAGAKSLINVLLADNLQGKTNTDAYVVNSRGFLYTPLPGDELNVLVATGQTPTIGLQLMLQAATGLLIANAAGASVPFICLEAMAVLAANTLVWCKFTGQ